MAKFLASTSDIRNKDFRIALDLQIKRHGDTALSLLRAISRNNENDRFLMECWLTGMSKPRKRRSFYLLRKIESHYRLPRGYFKALAHPYSAREEIIRTVHSSKRALLQWHLPDDFDGRTRAEQREILSWVRGSVLPGATDYGKFLVITNRHRYALLFPKILKARTFTARSGKKKTKGPTGQNANAPQRLASEMDDLVKFQTSTLAPLGYRRYLAWRPSTTATNVRAFGQMFGALTASRSSPIGGLGIPPSKLTFGLLVFPAVWDWFFQWREQRRGFYSVAERSMLYSIIGMTRKNRGWIRQNARLAKSLTEIKGLVSASDVALARHDWNSVCDEMFSFAQDRSKELCRIVQPHRDPFEAILPILNAESPLGEYKKIVDEIRQSFSSKVQSATEYAEKIRSYLLVRIALHLGVRQRNLRELLICPKDSKHRTAHHLQALRRGELRWNEIEHRWEAFIPAVAFKNSRSSFFKGRPFHIVLPNLDGLYDIIDEYLGPCRSLLLNGCADPGTFFVRSVIGRAKQPAEYDVCRLYDEWKRIIQRYGIYNPYTGRGAIKGLLPHGPHCVRDILATHILRKTGSYDLASFAIQDTAASVMEHYGRFMPQEKSARAAIILNEVWFEDYPKNA